MKPNTSTLNIGRAMVKKHTGKGDVSFFLGDFFSYDRLHEHSVAVMHIEFFEQRFEAKLSSENYHYHISGKLNGPNFYKGTIILEGEVIGDLTFTCYTNNTGCVLEGSWQEGQNYNMWVLIHWETKTE